MTIDEALTMAVEALNDHDGVRVNEAIKILLDLRSEIDRIEEFRPEMLRCLA